MYTAVQYKTEYTVVYNEGIVFCFKMSKYSQCENCKENKQTKSFLSADSGDQGVSWTMVISGSEDHSGAPW